jgi:phosphate acetyltransferase
MQELGLSAAVALSPMSPPPPSKYERLIRKAKEVPAASTVVVHPCDETSLRGAVEAAEAGLIVPILVGPRTKITAVARENRLDIARYSIRGRRA